MAESITNSLSSVIPLLDSGTSLTIPTDDTMLLTVRNLTNEPIVVHTHPSPSKFSAGFLAGTKAPHSASEFLLQPLLNSSTTLPRGIRRELILQRTQNGPEPLQANSPNTVEKGNLLGNGRDTHLEGFKIRISMMCLASWQVVKVPRECPWRVYTIRVCNFPYLQSQPLQHLLDGYNHRFQEAIADSLF